jgi:precorrin-6A/cobalt-precorrin-6A reductase
MGLASFAHIRDAWFLVRSVDAPEGACPPRMDVLLDRGPFTLDGERELLRRHRIDVLVTKDSGGAATAPKLTAAREAGVPVVILRRPPVPDGVPVAGGPEEAAAWLRAYSG